MGNVRNLGAPSDPLAAALPLTTSFPRRVTFLIVYVYHVAAVRLRRWVERVAAVARSGTEIKAPVTQ